MSEENNGVAGAPEDSGGTPPPGSSTDAAPPSSPAAPSEPTPEDFLRFDPFAPENAPAPTPPATGTPPAAAPTDPAVQPPTPQLPATPPAAPPPPPAADLGTQIAEAVNRLVDQRTQPPADPEAPPNPIPDYNFEIVPQLAAMLDHEDPAMRHRGVAYAMQATALTVHRNVHKQFETSFNQLVDALPRVIEERVATMNHQREIYSDLFGTYPTLNTDLARPLVSRIAQVVWEREFKGQRWSPALRDRIGQVAIEAFRQSGGYVPPPPAPAATPTPAARPAQPPTFGGTRGATDAGMSEEQKQIMDLFN